MRNRWAASAEDEAAHRYWIGGDILRAAFLTYNYTDRPAALA
jgi:hypothetical protein